MLNLPKFSFPIVGLTIGYENEKVGIKPKVNKVYDNKYDLSLVKKEVDEYDIVMENYFRNRDKNSKMDDTYSKTTAKTYDIFPKYYKDLIKILKDQKMLK